MLSRRRLFSSLLCKLACGGRRLRLSSMNSKQFSNKLHEGSVMQKTRKSYSCRRCSPNRHLKPVGVRFDKVGLLSGAEVYASTVSRPTGLPQQDKNAAEVYASTVSRLTGLPQQDTNASPAEENVSTADKKFIHSFRILCECSVAILAHQHPRSVARPGAKTTEHSH